MPACYFAATTQLALIDDIWCATRAGATGNHGLLEFLYTAFFSPDIARFRWFYELEQNARWMLFGPQLAAHHLVMFVYRLVTAWLACRVVRRYCDLDRTSCTLTATMVCLSYGLLFPVVPESRIGLQEPLFSLFLLAAIDRLIATIQTPSPVADRVADWRLAVLLVLLSGTKEPAVFIAALLLGIHLVLQWQRGKVHWGLNGGMLILMGLSVYRVIVVARNDTYSQAQGELNSLQLGWMYYRLRQTAEILVLGPSQISWLTVLCSLLLFAGCLKLLRDLLQVRMRMSALMLLMVLVGLLVLTAKMKLVLRYGEPLMWLATVVMAIGMTQWQMLSRSRWSEALAVVAVLAIGMGNYGPFNEQFVFQANAREAENRFLNDFSRRLEEANQTEVLIFGISPKHDWGLRRTEQAILVKMYLEEYRPMIQNRTAIHGVPVERTEKVHAGALLIGHVSDDILRKEFPELQVEVVSRITPLADSLAVRWHTILSEFAQHLGGSSSGKWIDGGSPEGLLSSPAWTLWRITEVTSTNAP